MTACTPPLQSSRAPPGFTTVDSCRSIDQYEEARLHELRSLSISDRNTLFPSSESPLERRYSADRNRETPFAKLKGRRVGARTYSTVSQDGQPTRPAQYRAGTRPE